MPGGAAVAPASPGVKLAGIGDEAAADLADQVRIHRELGLRGLELRTTGGRWIHECQADEHAALKESGLEVVAVDTPIGGWSTTLATPLESELATLAASAERCIGLGCRRLRIMSYPDDGRGDPDWAAEAIRRLRALAREAERLGVTLLHENCHGWGSVSAEHTLRMLDQVPGLRLLFDAGNGVWYGYDGPDFLRQVLAYVDHVHIKDAVRAGRGAPGDQETVAACEPGDGDARLAESLRLLQSAGYDGWYSVEPHLARIPHLSVTGSPAALASSYRAYVARTRSLLAAVTADLARSLA